ncbi:MAG: hypothetical protein J4F97_05435 [Pseudomonadales bacterium]|nr:hypothetical protein [Pseudomonadales bacterium]
MVVSRYSAEVRAAGVAVACGGLMRAEAASACPEDDRKKLRLARGNRMLKGNLTSPAKSAAWFAQRSPTGSRPRANW